VFGRRQVRQHAVGSLKVPRLTDGFIVARDIPAGIAARRLEERRSVPRVSSHQPPFRRCGEIVSHERPLGPVARATAAEQGESQRAHERGGGGRPAFRIRVQRFHEC
jgi:hypothetical protein